MLLDRARGAVRDVHGDEGGGRGECMVLLVVQAVCRKPFKVVGMDGWMDGLVTNCN